MKTTLEDNESELKAAQSAANEFCPVSPDFDISQYVKKTGVTNLTKCPKVPDMKNFVLKSIPPASKCPACICPKTKNIKWFL